MEVLADVHSRPQLGIVLPPDLGLGHIWRNVSRPETLTRMRHDTTVYKTSHGHPTHGQC